MAAATASKEANPAVDHVGLLMQLMEYREVAVRGLVKGLPEELRADVENNLGVLSLARDKLDDALKPQNKSVGLMLRSAREVSDAIGVCEHAMWTAYVKLSAQARREEQKGGVL